MPRTPNKKSYGPRKIDIDFRALDLLCAVQATQEEIAGYFECSADTISRAIKEHCGLRFADYYKIKSAKGRASLRSKQWDTAMKGNVQMMIHLGKAYLAQDEKLEVSIKPKVLFKTTVAPDGSLIQEVIDEEKRLKAALKE